ncbi:MAG TPA: DUF6515 family protein, partial [Bacteroidales bacterium]
MKCILLNRKSCATFKRYRKLTFLFVLVLAICTGIDVNAQRGGGHRSPSWHYSGRPARGAVVVHVPHAAVRYAYGRRDFYVDHGIYYRPFHEGFRVIAPPFGFRIGFLPRGYLSFYIGGFPYFYYCGTYYVQRDGQYEVVAPPVGAVVESLPPGYDKVVIDGQTYYTADGAQYKPILKDGEIWYQVIKSPTKAP